MTICNIYNILFGQKQGGIMKRNVGNIDRTIRLAAGSAVIIAGLYLQSWWGAFGLIPIVTSLAGWCPLYLLFGINTCKCDKKAD